MYGNRTVPVKDAPEITFVIQAGGSGARLGGIAKGLIRLGNERLIDRLVGLAEPRGWPIVIVANTAEAYEDLELLVVGDVVPGRGPPGGVVTALAVAQTEWVLTVACDMPFVGARHLDQLLDARSPEVDVVCFERDGRLEPLLALYRRTLLGPFSRRLPDQPSLHQLIRQEARLKLLTSEEPASLESLNTPEELERAQAGRR